MQRLRLQVFYGWLTGAIARTLAWYYNFTLDAPKEARPAWRQTAFLSYVKNQPLPANVRLAWRTAPRKCSRCCQHVQLGHMPVGERRKCCFRRQ